MGIDHTAVGELLDRSRREIDEGLLPSCQVAVAFDGEVVAQETFGTTASGDSSWYLMYSATKGVVSAAFLQLLSERLITLATPVADVVPGFGANGKSEITIEQVMTYTSGFARAPMGPGSWDTRESRLDQMSRWRLDGTLGEYDYHITSGHWVLAAVIEEIDGVDFREAINRRLGDALGLTSLRLGPPTTDQALIERPVLCGEPATAEEFMAALGVSGIDAGEANDENLVALGAADVVEVGLPGGGAVSTAGDLALLYQALLGNTGELWDPDVLADARGNVRVTAFDSIRGVDANRTLAYMVAGTDGQSGGRGLGHGANPLAFGHDGIGGQLAFADPTTGISVSYLTNGIDRNILRQQRRARSIATRANACGTVD